MQDWDFPFHRGFQYDDITDEHIAAALVDVDNLACVLPDIEWQCDGWLERNQTIPAGRKHAYRVAALVHAFRGENVLKNGISLDTFCVSQCCSCVPDGHHRIRALQYLGFPAGPFWLGGHVEPLEDLVRLAGTTPPPGIQQYCEASLLVTAAPDDIVLSR